MGSIDRMWVKVSCEDCGVSQTNSSTDKGSGWSGSHWNDLGDFSDFDVTVSGSGKSEPTVSAGTCKKCGGEATIKKAYGFNKPGNF